MAELENLIKQMVANGESEQAIDLVVQAYKKKHGDDDDIEVEENIFYDKLLFCFTTGICTLRFPVIVISQIIFMS